VISRPEASVKVIGLLEADADDDEVGVGELSEEGLPQPVMTSRSPSSEVSKRRNGCLRMVIDTFHETKQRFVAQLPVR